MTYLKASAAALRRKHGQPQRSHGRSQVVSRPIARMQAQIRGQTDVTIHQPGLVTSQPIIPPPQQTSSRENPQVMTDQRSSRPPAEPKTKGGKARKGPTTKRSNDAPATTTGPTTTQGKVPMKKTKAKSEKGVSPRLPAELLQQPRSTRSTGRQNFWELDDKGEIMTHCSKGSRRGGRR